jgi:hypothetical protein
MPGDVRYTPNVVMAPQDPSVRPAGFRPTRFSGGMSSHQHNYLQQQKQQRFSNNSPVYYQGTRIPIGGHQMVSTTTMYPIDGRSQSSRGWEYSSPGYPYYTPPTSDGSRSQAVVNPMIPHHGIVPPSRYVSGPPPISAGPPRLPDRRIMPYGNSARRFWVDQFAFVDVSRQEPLPQDWHPFVDVVTDQPPSQPPVTGGVMAVLDYDVKVMAEFVANVSCNFINLPKPWPSLTLFVERVFNQTRLPSSTVILGITYLSKRLSLEEPPYDGDPNAPLIPTSRLPEYLTMSFILANKFLDDNTFTNSSWSDISGIARDDLNISERDWLQKLGYTLHLNPTEPKGWSTWRIAWETWQFEATGKTSPPLLTPVLSRTNSSGSSSQCNSIPRPDLTSSYSQLFPSTWATHSGAAYLTPPISPTFDASLESDFQSPVTPPSNYQWGPSKPLYHSNQLTWRPLPNTRNVPMSAYAHAPPLQKSFPPPSLTHFWEGDQGGASPWCECNVCLSAVPTYYPEKTGMAMAN